MTLEFQIEIFKFILQVRDGHKYIPYLNNAIFDSPIHQLIFDLVKKYYDKYTKAPTKPNLIEWFDSAYNKTENKQEKIHSSILDNIKQLYKPFNNDIEYIKDKIVEFAQYQLTKNLFKDYSGRIGEGNEILEVIQKEMNKIVKLGYELDSGDTHRGGSVLKDYKGIYKEEFDGVPCFLKGINSLTTARGFHKPQLVIFIGGPKSFKTGFLIKFGVEYMRQGLKVYYADAENGLNFTRRRIYQSMLECTAEELFTDEKRKELNRMIKNYLLVGGDMEIGYYASGVNSVKDIEIELDFLKSEKGFVPDLIIWDDPDNFMANDTNKRKELRHNIHGVYVDIINLNNKLGIFSLGASQVNRAAIGKATMSMKDFSEDINKARKCHAAFAICRTEEEIDNGTARIIPVLQRDGVRYNGTNQCIVRINEDRMLIEETTFEDVLGELDKKDIKDE